MRGQEEPVQIGPQDRVFVLTGAGVSAESGLKTFRDQGGLWEGHRVEEVATPEAWEEDAERVWRFYSERRKAAKTAQPNAAHQALAELEERLGERFFMVTQNVDDLHERAGSRRVAHMHGELLQSRCEFYPHGCRRPPFRDEGLYETADAIARCACGGRIRPHIVWFGEMPLEMERIEREIGDPKALRFSRRMRLAVLLLQTLIACAQEPGDAPQAAKGTKDHARGCRVQDETRERTYSRLP